MLLEDTRSRKGLMVSQENIVPNRKLKNAVKIYAMGDMEGDGENTRVKLGMTRQGSGRRLMQHEKRGPTTIKMRWLVGVWGMPSDERALKQFWTKKGLLESGEEWFLANEELRAWLRWLGDQPFAAKTEEELDDLKLEDSRHWMPGVGHMKVLAPKQLSFDHDCHDKKLPWSDLDTSEIMDGDYYTHETMIIAARETMGHIDLDPASCRAANVGVRGYVGVGAKKFFGLKEDGLQRQWSGKVWLNPPFGQWELWAPKALAEFNSGRVYEMCVFCTASAATGQSFHTLVYHADAVFLPCGRFGCWGPKASSARDGNIIFYFGKNRELFRDAFSPHGTVFYGASK